MNLPENHFYRGGYNMAGTYRSGEAELLRKIVRGKLEIARKYKDSCMKSLEELIIGRRTLM